MWRDRLEFLLDEMVDEDENGKIDMTVFPLILHPDTSGMAHILPMIERFLRWVLDKDEAVEFMTFEDAAKSWKEMQRS